ncbi:hypothetical protein [Hymenobacter lucidus]|uniref:Uncharacterized protein n=1 Tax=Hymenobacter lucidus TaxID=2880930 RepID=A0ABS8AW13_9BACT|nr:hypothetical protein [Hymenobacter lucidus]MCB2409607.1 hypothetical protein [Hymenobacter lucidus]
MYDERYDNHFRRLTASRDTLAAFADFTLDQYRQGLSGRTTGGGQRQSGTQTEDQAFESLKKLVQATDRKLLQPRFYDHPAEKALFYPDKLGGLTQAPKTKRLTRFTAYVQQLEDHPDAGLQAAGAQVKALLVAYTAATAIKNQGSKAVKDTVSALGSDALALADALWDVHCAALYVHRRDPAKAPTYFAYNLLPNPNPARQRAKRAAAVVAG